jgi:uridylate kinase
MSALSIPTVVEPYVRQRALRHLEKRRVLIFVAGTGNPFFTTDTAAALRASEMDCDVVLKGTKVDGVYTKDPKQHAGAEFIPHLTYRRVMSDNLHVMDTTAITLMEENHIPILVFSIYNDNGFLNALTHSGRFTKITH